MCPEQSKSKHNGDGKVDGRKDPARADHLRPHWWKKGQSGNPNGRNRGDRYFEKAYKGLLETSIPVDVFESKAAAQHCLRKMVRNGAKIIDFIALAQIIKAMGGDTRAAAEITDRVDGKAIQRAILQNQDLQILVTSERPEIVTRNGNGQALTHEND